MSSIPNCKHISLPVGKDKIKAFISAFFFNKYCDVVILNWHENLLNIGKEKFSAIGVLKFFSYFLFFKVISRKVIFVRHNIYPHAMSGWRAFVANKLTSIVANISDYKISHSGHLIKYGYKYVPHPLYNIECNSVDQNYELKKNSYYVIFGRIERYKKIECVISEWNSEKTLIIAGSASDTAYLSELRGIAKDKPIVIISRYIEEKEAQLIVANAKGLIVSHADEDMLVSGSFFYALSLGTPVFAVSSEFFKWVKEQYDFCGLFMFSTPKGIVESVSADTHDVISRQEIIRQAQVLFGDNTVYDAWYNLFKNMFKDFS